MSTLESLLNSNNVLSTIEASIRNFHNYNNNNLRFVFIIPSYNNEKWIHYSIKNIINQTYKNWHILYVDDNSNDNTNSIINEYSENNDQITVYKNNKKYGQAFNRYFCYKQCKNEDYCILLDGDDWLIDTFVLEYLKNFIIKNDIDLTYRNFKYYTNGKISNGYKLDEYDKTVINNKSYRSDIWRAGHLRVIKAKYLKNINILDFLDQNFDFIQCCTDLVESWASLEQCMGRHKMVNKDIMVYNKDNSCAYKTSEYNELNKEYRKIIENKVKTITPYKNYNMIKKNKDLVIINLENSDYKININKYLHEMKDNFDVLLWKFSELNTFKYLIQSDYRNVIKFDSYYDKLYNILRVNNKLTYIIACYNCEKFIDQTLTSLMKQTNKNFDVILINDKSSDNLRIYIQELFTKYKSLNIRYYENKYNIGYAQTLARGTGLCNTEYFAHLDSDDTIEPQTTDIIYKYINNYPNIGFFYTNFNYCDRNLKFKSKGFCRKIPTGLTNLETNSISHLRIFKKKGYYKTLGYIENDNYRKGAEDKDIYFKIEEKNSVMYIDEYLYNYRYNDTSLTKKDGGKEQCVYNYELAKKSAYDRRKNNSIIRNFLNT